MFTETVRAYDPENHRTSNRVAEALLVPKLAAYFRLSQSKETGQGRRVSPQLVDYFAPIAIAFVAYFIAGKLGQATSNIRSSNLGPVWPAYGVAVASFLVYGHRVWAGIASAAFLV